jgi:hypothetical protein
MEQEYPWYSVVQQNEVLMQGDLIENCPVIIPPNTLLEDDIPTIEINKFDVIILTQSCDLENGKISSVLVCPYFTLQEFGNYQKFVQSTEGKEQLRRGNLPGYHLLNKFDGSAREFYDDFLVVDFRNVYGVSFSFLKEFAKVKPQRLRLLSPYREHLSQALARYFMRVGLPSNIPEFKKKQQQ